MRIVAKGRRGEGKKIFRENRFQVPDSRSGKRLLFQRNFYIYPLVKRKPRICFYSRILLVTSHSGFPFLFFFSLSFLFSLFFFNARHVLLPSPESLLHATRSLILAIFSTSRSANSSRSGRASVHRSGGVVVYFVPVWIDLLAACLPQHGETYVPFSSRLEIDPPRERKREMARGRGCIFECVERSTSEILAPVKMRIDLGNETADNTCPDISAFPTSPLASC